MQLEIVGLCVLIATVQANENTKTEKWETLKREKLNEKEASIKGGGTRSVWVHPEVHNSVPRDSDRQNDPIPLTKSEKTLENGERKMGAGTASSYGNASSSVFKMTAVRVESNLTDVNTKGFVPNTTALKIHKNQEVLNNLNLSLFSRKGKVDRFSITNPSRNTKYLNKNTCRHIDGSSKSICPEGFKSLSNKYCMLIKKNEPFPPACPYPHSMFYDNTVTIDTYFGNVPVWIHAFRNLSSGFPDFEWFEHGNRYGSTFLSNISNRNDVSNTNCLIRKNQTFYRVSCSEKHAVICMYSVSQIMTSSASKLCQNEPNYCIFAHYDFTKQTCFCQTVNRLQPPKNNFCRKLAEPLFPFQTQLLIAAENEFAKGGSKCWIGLQKEESTGTYQWSSRNDIVSYTQWAKPYNCKYSEGAFQFGKYDFAGWTLVKDRTLGCAICETKAHFKQPHLFLYRNNVDDNTLLLYVDNLITVTQSDYSYNIYCFSDDNDDAIKTTKELSALGEQIFELDVAGDRPSHYWCETFHYSSFTAIRSDLLVTHWNFDYVNEFSLHVQVKMPSQFDPFINDLHVEVCKNLRKRIEIYYNNVVSVRPMRAYFNESTYYMNMTVHLTIRESPKTATEEYLNLLEILSNISIITGVFSSEICPLTTTLTPNGVILEWPETRIGGTAIPSNILCLDEEHDLLPVTRKCEGDFLDGGKWGEPIGSCSGNTTYSATTEELFNLLNQNTSADKLTVDLFRITQEYTDKHSIDIHLIAKNLDKLASMDEENIDGISYSNILSNIMNFDKETLKQAQLLLNSTDKILSTLDNVLTDQNPTTIVSSRLIVRIIDLQDSNIMGVALYKETPEANSFEQYKLSLLFKNASLENLTRNKQLEIAALLPFELPNKNKPYKLIVTVFYNNLLFNEQERVYDVSKIMSILIPGITGRLKFPIQILFKLPEGIFRHTLCSHWQYGINPLSVSIHGQWKIDDVSKTMFGLLATCEFFHMTHFGHLLKHESEHHERPLEIITIVGSSLSLIGIIPIYATAILFKNWRKRPGNIILIHFCNAITLQIILTFLLYAIKKDGTPCKIVGALLHYSILAEFCWMLVIAILQYNRYVVVFRTREVNIIKKSLLVGWVIPLFPVLIILCISPNNYALNEKQFCYITGHYFHFGLILPVVLIISINTIILIIIMHNISQSNVTTSVERSRNYKRKILLAFLLFFILGITWTFGLIAALGAGTWSSYLFCITATLRGLVLFLYFIFGNKETRFLWRKHTTYFLNRTLLYIKIKYKIFK